MAYTEVNRAYKLLEKNLELFPEFKGSLKSLGVIHAIVGTIPDNYKWGLKLIGSLDGTIAQGKEELEQVIAYSRQSDFLFKDETLVSYAFLLLHLDNQSDLDWKTITEENLDLENNPPACYAVANIAKRKGRSPEALVIV